ncbi:MAG TPA: hypothetical protein VK897_02650 [Anaerolineales bacterium]|nr:hypothetical protein [Anaerolineales bacterium]
MAINKLDEFSLGPIQQTKRARIRQITAFVGRQKIFRFLLIAFIFPTLVTGCATGATGPLPTATIPYAVTTVPSTSDKTPTPEPIKYQELTLPPQGLYDSCIPSDAECIDHLDVLAEKGFTLIVNYGQLYGDAESQIAYADRAFSLGMKVIWAILPRLDRPDDWMLTKFPELSADSRCSDNDCVIEYFVNLVKDHPATWGYYVADEIRPTEYIKLQKWSDVIRQADPNHPRLLVTAGSNDPMEHYYWYYSYMKDIADVFGPCYYPYGYIESGNELTRYTGAAANHAQYWADKLGGQSVMVLQAFSQARYSQTPLCMLWPMCAGFPTYEQMKAQRDQTILNSHPAIILWWTYQDILLTDDPQKHLDELAAAAFSPLPPSQVVPTVMIDSCPQDWNCEDIGNPAMKGTLAQEGDAWILRGAGWDIWSTPFVNADQFYYVWQPMTENGSISAGIYSFTVQDLSSKMGVMVRQTFDPISPYYAVLVTPKDGVKVQVRSDFSQETVEVASVFMELPLYVKIVRHGTEYSSYVSSDGVSWSAIPNSTKVINSLSDPLMAGLAVASGDEMILQSVTFDHVEILSATP